LGDEDFECISVAADELFKNGLSASLSFKRFRARMMWDEFTSTISFANSNEDLSDVE